MWQYLRNNSGLASCTFIGCAGLLVFFPCLSDFFVSDDFVWISKGAGLSFDHLFRSTEEATFNVFRPLVPWLFWAFHHVFGLAPFGYHLGSVVIHILNGVLLHGVLLRLSLKRDVALVSAVVFVAHFAHEESVFWVSSICVLCCWLFCLCSILLFLDWLRKRGVLRYFLSLGFAMVALFLREDAVALPLILLGVTVFQHVRSKNYGLDDIAYGIGWRTSAYLIPYLGGLSLYLYLRSLILPYLTLGDLLSASPINLVRNAAYFIVNLTVPIRLVFDVIGYGYSRSINSAVSGVAPGAEITVATGLGAIAVTVAFILWMRRTHRHINRLLIIPLVTIFPFLFFEAYALRLTYLPLLGFSPLAAHFLVSLTRRVASSSRSLRGRHVFLSLILVVGFNFLVLSERHIWWSRASTISQETLQDAERVISSLPAGSTVCFTGLPTRLHGAYVLGNGFKEAMHLLYPKYDHEIRTLDKNSPITLEEAISGGCFTFKYEEGSFRQLSYTR